MPSLAELFLCCSRPNVDEGAPLVVIAGPPASGKGTQCEKIRERYGLVHVSTGDILRENVKQETALGKEAKQYMDRGELVPDSLLIKLVKDRLGEADIRSKGCLLDGFPRTGEQAKAMKEAGMTAAAFLLIDVPDAVLVERGVGRRLDPETGDIFHLKFKPPPMDILSRLIHRSDDQEEKIMTRLKAYHDQINGILPFFENVMNIDGNNAPDDVFRSITGKLDNKLTNQIVVPMRTGATSTASKSPIVIISGPPASGKGTQCELIKEKFGYVHISTGDILRDNVKKETELGKKAKTYMDSGALVPDDLLIDLVKNRLQEQDIKEHGCLLDGFPRTPAQAKAMKDAGLEANIFLLVEVPDDVLVERGVGRRLDPDTGDIFHLKFKPPPDSILARLVHRSDDHEDKIRARLEAYHSQIEGILGYFEPVLKRIDGNTKPDDVFANINTLLSNMQ
mmetsp:Transcript_299/g.640  ORF Transcript_299/g.640 Transcript_299/m.640 type:complete len:451 (+) Transcript_299:142-1494(+)